MCLVVKTVFLNSLQRMYAICYIFYCYQSVGVSKKECIKICIAVSIAHFAQFRAMLALWKARPILKKKMFCRHFRSVNVG